MLLLRGPNLAASMQREHAAVFKRTVHYTYGQQAPHDDAGTTTG
jgi:hypothetical protein